MVTLVPLFLYVIDAALSRRHVSQDYCGLLELYPSVCVEIDTALVVRSSILVSFPIDNAC
jgi:hypothetical protein